VSFSVKHFVVSAFSAHSAVHSSFPVNGHVHRVRAAKASAVSLFGGAIASTDDVSATKWSKPPELLNGSCGPFTSGWVNDAGVVMSDAVIGGETESLRGVPWPTDSVEAAARLQVKSPPAGLPNCPASDLKQLSHNTATARKQSAVTAIFFMKFSWETDSESRYLGVNPSRSYIL